MTKNQNTKTYRLLLFRVSVDFAPSFKMYRPANLRKNVNDRFIPLRIPVDLNADSPLSLTFSPKELTQGKIFFNQAKKIYNHINYQNVLREALLPLDKKVLNFHPPKSFTPHKFTSMDETWPVKPRKKPVIEAPDCVLDMPHFDTDICHHVADWSSKNGLATIFQNEVHSWYPDSDIDRHCSKTRERAQDCIKWNGDGIHFALGLFPNNIGLYSALVEEIVSESSCCVSPCHVYSMEWIGDMLITGCSRGVLAIFTKHLKCSKRIRHAHDSAIINIAKSCNNANIATSGLDRSVIIWKMPDLEPHFQIDAPTVALSWHPWKNTLLAIGINCEQSRVIIWNVNTHEQVAYEKQIYKNSSIDSLTFNPISGELVVSYTPCEGDLKYFAAISVFTNINKIVEELYMHRGTVPYLLWGKGGHLLASISSDENLCIWKFFGPSKDNNEFPMKTKQNKNRSKLLATIR